MSLAIKIGAKLERERERENFSFGPSLWISNLSEIILKSYPLVSL
jgi:hypothetical protein